MYSDCRGRLQHKGPLGLCKMQRKNHASRMLLFFLTKTSNAENKATGICLQELARGHHLIYITLPLTKGLNMCASQFIRLTPPPLPSLLSILKDFPIRQYVQAACDTEGTSIILILCVCSFLEHSSDPSMKSTCAEPHMSYL